MQGMVTTSRSSPYISRIQPVLEKKARLGVDSWGSVDAGVRHLMEPIEETFAKEFPDFDPYPFGRFHFVRRLLLNILVAEPMAQEYAELLRGLDDSELDALADSFSFESCQVRESLVEQLAAG